MLIYCYIKTQVKVRSPVRDTDYFSIVAYTLQGDSLAPYLFIIGLHYVLRTSFDKMKDNGFKLEKERGRRYHAQTITDAVNADDPSHVETLLRRLERAAGGIGLHVIEEKMGTCALIKEVTIKDMDIYRFVIWKSDLTDKIKAVFFSKQMYQFCYADALHGR